MSERGYRITVTMAFAKCVGVCIIYYIVGVVENVDWGWRVWKIVGECNREIVGSFVFNVFE